MADINTLVDNILLKHITVEDNVCDRVFDTLNKNADIIVRFLITAAVAATVSMAAVCN